MGFPFVIVLCTLKGKRNILSKHQLSMRGNKVKGFISRGISVTSSKSGGVQSACSVIFLIPPQPPES